MTLKINKEKKEKIAPVTPLAPSAGSSAIDVLSRDLSCSRQIAHRVVRELERETSGAGKIEGLSPQRTLLLEEHMANIALRWISHQDSRDIDHISLRDFSQLTKLLMDMVERRQRLEQQSQKCESHENQSHKNQSHEGITPQQYTAMRQVLMGEGGEADDNT